MRNIRHDMRLQGCTLDGMSDEQAIREVIEEWMRASAAGKTERVLQLMAEDVVFLLPARPPIRGRQQFAAMSAGMAEKIKTAGRPDIREIKNTRRLRLLLESPDADVDPAAGR